MPIPMTMEAVSDLPTSSGIPSSPISPKLKTMTKLIGMMLIKPATKERNMNAVSRNTPTSEVARLDS